MKKKRWYSVVSAATILAVIYTFPPALANAAEDEPPSPLEALQSVTSSAEGEADEALMVLENQADASAVDTYADGTMTLDVGGSETVIPPTSDEPVVIGDVQIELPNSEVQAQSERVDDAVVSFDNEDGSSTLPVLKDDGSVQITTVLHDESAPTSYDYNFDLPAGVTMIIDQAGIVTAADGDGLVVGVAPAWAVDATGAAVPSHYEIHGSTLTQVVDHRSADFAYPIVADPWAGTRLFDSVWSSGYQKVSMITSAWGRWIQATGGGSGWAYGQLILSGSGWVEAVRAVPSLTSKATYYQQYQCHVLGAYTPLSGGSSWDLEGWRGNRPWWRTDGGAFPYKCNWP